MARHRKQDSRGRIYRPSMDEEEREVVLMALRHLARSLSTVRGANKGKTARRRELAEQLWGSWMEMGKGAASQRRYH